MRATGKTLWEWKHLKEWHVNLDVDYLQLDEYKRIRHWVEDQCNGIFDTTFRISTNSGYVAFLDEDDAMLFYIAFS